jgi:nucleoside phosphorylase
VRWSVADAVRRTLTVVGALALIAPLAASGSEPVRSGAAGPCVGRTLLLSAMPVELAPLLRHTTVPRTSTAEGRTFYVGRLRGHAVVLALSGIGPVNARATTRAALRHFRCGSRSAISAVVFSGVAGGARIGDVVIPSRWTLDGGKHFVAADRDMLAASRWVARQSVPLQRQAPAGDPACTCAVPTDTVATVTVEHRPKVRVGGRGQTTDPFGGRALPCAPSGGDVFGCEPCVTQLRSADASHFGTGIVPFVDPAFFTGYSSSGGGSGYVAQDQETAAVGLVAGAHGVPFLALRGVSDGGGDPLGLPGFPVQFFYYRQLAADNAAIATEAFLAAWDGSGA